MKYLKKWLLGWLLFRPHFTVGSPDNPYLLRWHVIPRNQYFNIYLHKFLRDDDDRALHDHPWPTLSILLHGEYIEQTTNGRKLYRAGSTIHRHAAYAHRVILPEGKPCWTLFITGRRVREWGFHCPKGWVHWKDFVDESDVGNIGKGCGEFA